MLADRTATTRLLRWYRQSTLPQRLAARSVRCAGSPALRAQRVTRQAPSVVSQKYVWIICRSFRGSTRLWQPTRTGLRLGCIPV